MYKVTFLNGVNYWCSSPKENCLSYEKNAVLYILFKKKITGISPSLSPQMSPCTFLFFEPSPAPSSSSRETIPQTVVREIERFLKESTGDLKKEQHGYRTKQGKMLDFRIGRSKKTIFNFTLNIYRPSTKLRKSNVFSHVLFNLDLTVQGSPLPMHANESCTLCNVSSAI